MLCFRKHGGSPEERVRGWKLMAVRLRSLGRARGDNNGRRVGDGQMPFVQASPVSTFRTLWEVRPLRES